MFASFGQVSLCVIAPWKGFKLLYTIFTTWRLFGDLSFEVLIKQCFSYSMDAFIWENVVLLYFI